MKEDTFLKWIVRLLIGYAVIGVFVIFMFKYVLMVSRIPSRSMEGTLSSGDIVVSTRVMLSEETIHRYDILVFVPPDFPDTFYIKRVIGLPGETVVIEGGKVYVDGVETDDSFIKDSQNRRGDGAYVVPESCYFFLGDNRNNSGDSRFWTEKYVPLKNICAKAQFVVSPLSHAGSLKYR